jgi:hypothetical protein
MLHTWPELPKQLSTIAMRRAFASLFTVNIEGSIFVTNFHF